MTLASYSDLETAVANWLARVGDTNVTSNVADFITLCEARMAYGSDETKGAFPSRPLRIRAMETTRVIPIQAAVVVTTVGGNGNAITLTPGTAITSYSAGQTWQFTAASANTSGVTCAISGLSARSVLKGSALSALATGDIVSGQTVQLYDDGTELVLMPGTATCALPTNYLAMRSIYLDLNPRIALDYLTPNELNKLYASSTTDQPQAYTIEGDTIRTAPQPDTAYYTVINYYQKFGALSSATNWLMTNTPNVYLYGTLLEAAIFFGMTDESQFYHGLYLSACDGLQLQDVRDRHSGSTLTIRNDTGNP